MTRSIGKDSLSLSSNRYARDEEEFRERFCAHNARTVRHEYRRKYHVPVHEPMTVKSSVFPGIFPSFNSCQAELRNRRGERAREGPRPRNFRFLFSEFSKRPYSLPFFPDFLVVLRIDRPPIFLMEPRNDDRDELLKFYEDF